MESSKRKSGASPATERTSKKLVQFNWRRHWSKKVAPHLNKECVQAALDFGMSLYCPGWSRGDPPYLLGAIPSDRCRVVTNKLSWYQPHCRCHWIAFFSMAIGILNYPHLDWRFISGDMHTVPVGYGADSEPTVVMDILLFESMTAEESIAHTQKKLDTPTGGENWDKLFDFFVRKCVPRIRDAAQELNVES